MEDLLGFLIFVIIAVISLINRLMKDSKAGADSDETFQKVSPPEDMPEATRRMLFGDDSWDIPVAKPKVSGRTITVSKDEWQPVPPEQPQWTPAGRTVPHQPQQRVPATGRPTPASRPEQRPVVVREATRASRPAAQTQRPAASTASRQRTAPAGSPAPRERKPAAARQRASAQARPQQHAQTQPRHAQRRRPPVPVVQETALAHDLHGALRSRDEIVRALVLREILGPPRALDEMMF